MKFGRVWIRLWYVCFAGKKIPCGIMTTDERFKHDWSATPVRRDCCAKIKQMYRHKWKLIMQISALGEEFLTTAEAHAWNTDISMYQGICKQAEMARHSESEVKKEIRQAVKRVGACVELWKDIRLLTMPLTQSSRCTTSSAVSRRGDFGQNSRWHPSGLSMKTQVPESYL